MSDEQFGAAQQPEYVPSVSLDTLNNDPERYRRQLMIILEGRPFDHPVSAVHGQEAEALLDFCLNPDNMDAVGEDLNRISADKSPKEDSRNVLKSINEGGPSIGSNISQANLQTERAHRKRLLFWVNYLDGLMESTQGNGGEASKAKDPAA